MSVRSTLLVYCLLVLLPYLSGQDGGTAVVVGIADFQDPAVTDLRYANADARAFVDYLTDPRGGGLASDDVRLLTDTAATLAAIQSALRWQADRAATDRPAYLYLATHGDVATDQLESGGYLLAHDTPLSNYDLLALSTDYLDDHLQDLRQRGARPVLITDACHAGTLAGDAVAGRQLTATQLLQRREQEVRMLSCQPYELSQEGEQWGGGRGAFSYHLVQALYGAADEDSDLRIDLFELDDYVQRHVAGDTERQQHPEVAGGRKDQVLVQLQAADQQTYLTQRSEELQASFEQAALATASPTAQRNYLRFLRAVHAGELLFPEGKNALAYRAGLLADPGLLPLRGLIDERLTVALLDSVQQAIIAYLAADPDELRDRDDVDGKYQLFVDYLEAAAGLLPAADPRLPGIRAKTAYFRGLLLRLAGDRQARIADSLYALGADQLRQATELQPEAAYLHNEHGLLQLRLGDKNAAYTSFVRASELAPDWALPYSNLGMLLKASGIRSNYPAAQEYYARAIALNPDLAGVYVNLGNLYYEDGRRDSAEVLLRQALALHPTDAYGRYNLAVVLGDDAARRDQATALFTALIGEAGPLVADSHLKLGKLYLEMGRPDSARHHLERARSLWPGDIAPYAALRSALLAGRGTAGATAYFRELVSREPTNALGYLSLAQVDTLSAEWLRLLRTAPLHDTVQQAVARELGLNFYWEGLYGHAEESLRQATRSKQNVLPAYFFLSAFLSSTGQHRKGLQAIRETLKLAADTGDPSNYCQRYANDSDFNNLREQEDFRRTYQKYCGGLPPGG